MRILVRVGVLLAHGNVLDGDVVSIVIVPMAEVRYVWAKVELELVILGKNRSRVGGFG